jgi:chromosome partitioning protein
LFRRGRIEKVDTMAKTKKKEQKESEALCIAVLHQKGGTGKTTTAINLAGFIAKAGHRVLVVDMDPQACATSGLGIDKATVQDSMYDVVVGGGNGSSAVLMRDIILETEVEGLHLAPASLDLLGAEPHLYGMGRERVLVLHNALADVRGFYDFIIIDTPPGTGQCLLNGILAVEHVIVSMTPNVFAAEGVEIISSLMEDLKEELQCNTDVLGAVLTDCPGQTQLARHVQNEWERVFKKPILGIIPHDLRICEAQMDGTPISHYEDTCDAACAYGDIADFIIDLGTQR